MSDRDIDVKELAQEVVDELQTGSYGDKFVLTRRQLVALAGSGLSVGALATFGVSEAQAQEAVGAVGTESEPIDVYGDTVRSNSAEIAGTATAEALEAESASTESVEIAGGRTVKHVETASYDSGNSWFQWTGLSKGTQYIISTELVVNSNGNIHLTFNEDDSSANYEFYDETGTPQTGEDTIRLVNVTTSNIRLGGHIAFAEAANRCGVDNRLAFGPSWTDGYADRGNYTDTSGISSVEIHTDDPSGSETTMELYEVL